MTAWIVIASVASAVIADRLLDPGFRAALRRRWVARRLAKTIAALPQPREPARVAVARERLERARYDERIAVAAGCGRVYVDRLREETDAAAQALQRLGVDP